MHKTFFSFCDSPFIQVAWKCVLGVVFPFWNISGRYFQPRHQISSFFKKVGNALFTAYFLTTAGNSTFSSQIVRYGQTIIGNEKSGLRRCFHIPIMPPYHVYIQFSNSRFFFSNFISYAYFLKEYFKAPVEKLFFTKWRDFFQKIKITIYVAQNLILTNETPLKSMILNKFSFGSFRFGGRKAKIF